MKKFLLYSFAVLVAAVAVSVYRFHLHDTRVMANPCAMDNDHPPFSCFDQCYDEYPGVRRETVEADSYGLPMGWHSQISAFLNSRQPTPNGLPPYAMALPDLSGSNAVANLRVAIYQSESLGTGDLYHAVRDLKAKTVDAATRAKVRDILFMWVGVQGVEPSSRGQFIDARELEFLEKITGEPFVQLGILSGAYSNPLPIAATAVKEIFNETLDFYAQELLRQAAGGAPAHQPVEILFDWEWHYDQARTFLQWRDYKGRRIWFHGYYGPTKRRVCYSYLKD